jgi:hypothetical protein
VTSDSHNPLPVSDDARVREVYRCGVDATVEVTCDRCPDPDGCIDFALEAREALEAGER